MGVLLLTDVVFDIRHEDFSFFMVRRAPVSTLFPYTTLFRSGRRGGLRGRTSSGTRTRHRSGCECRMRRSEEHTSELQSQSNLVCRLLLEKKKGKKTRDPATIYMAMTPELDVALLACAGIQAV